MISGNNDSLGVGSMMSPKGASKEAIQYHYDTGNEFYKLWLDDRLVYSAGCWLDRFDHTFSTETLEDAQLRKLDYHLRAGRVMPGDHILDVGCGWGALMARAIQNFKADSATGLTLSQNQYDYIVSENLLNTKVILQSYEDYDPKFKFNCIFSIGSFEHFAKPGLEKRDRIEIYNRFFLKMRDILVRKGRICLQTICWSAVNPEEARSMVPETVFPESDLPFLDEVICAAISGFDVVRVETTQLDYVRTLEHWIQRLRLHKHEAYLMPGGQEQYLFFENYLRRSIIGFRERITTLARFVFEKA